MSRHLTLRINDAELEFLNKLASEKGITRAAVARQLFLQQVALGEIEKAVSSLVDSRLAAVQAELAELRQEIGAAAKRDDLIKSTNFLIKELKK